MLVFSALTALAPPAPARERRVEANQTVRPSPLQMTPLPPRRPDELTSAPAPKGEDTPATATSPAEPPGPSACTRTFAEQGGMALDSAPDSGTGECGIEDPVAFKQIGLADGSKVELDSTITVRCAFALEILAWVRDDLTVIAARENGRIARLVGVGGHACRPRNGVPGAQISEHATGNALDLSALDLQDKRSIALTGGDALSRAVREAVRKSACERFTTVLGPGSDASHKDHLHLDMRQRSNGYRICQWTLD